MDGDPLTTVDYILFAKESGLSLFEMEIMSIGMVLDHIQSFTDLKTPNNKKVRKATKADIRALKAM